MTDDNFNELYAELADNDIMKHYPYTFDKKRFKAWIKQNMERYRHSDSDFELYA